MGEKEWKDYTTLLPESIRESFKEWAKFNNFETVVYFEITENVCWFSSYSDKACSNIGYELNASFDFLENHKVYEVKDLVGE